MTEVSDEIKSWIKGYFYSKRKKEEFIPGKSIIPLSVPSYNWEEVVEALDSLLSTWVTMGKKISEFERMFANYIGVKHASMVNSGSSANLLAFSVLTNPLLKNRITKGEVIVPTTAWSTSVYPIINVGLTPILADVSLENFNIDVYEMERAINDKTKAIVVVHALGYPCDMKRIMEVAEEHNLYVIEDACEAHGAQYFGKKVGSFGDLATFSFFFSHHISTIEGGMLVTNNDDYIEIAKALRAHGWIRDLKHKDAISRKYPDIDQRFLFINIGFNLRPTEIQGAFGIHQMRKLEKFIAIRRDNAKYWTERLSKYSGCLILPEEKKGYKHVYFGYPITVKPNAPFTRGQLMSFLERRRIETRPIMAGNMAEQPAMRLFKYKVIGDLHNSRLIMRNSFFFGNHHGIGELQREYIADCIEEFIKKRKTA